MNKRTNLDELDDDTKEAIANLLWVWRDDPKCGIQSNRGGNVRGWGRMDSPGGVMCGFLKGWREEWRQRPQKGKEVPGCVLLEVTGFQQDVPNWTVKVGYIVMGQQEAKVQDMRQTAWGRVTFRSSPLPAGPNSTPRELSPAPQDSTHPGDRESKKQSTNFILPKGRRERS